MQFILSLFYWINTNLTWWWHSWSLSRKTGELCFSSNFCQHIYKEVTYDLFIMLQKICWKWLFSCDTGKFNFVLILLQTTSAASWQRAISRLGTHTVLDLSTLHYIDYKVIKCYIQALLQYSRVQMRGVVDWIDHDVNDLRKKLEVNFKICMNVDRKLSQKATFTGFSLL